MTDLTQDCLLCLRISLGQILIYTYDLYDEKTVAEKVAHKAAELIRDAYIKDRAGMCGKSPSGLIAGSIYVAGLILGERKTQIEVAYEVGVSKVTCRNRYISISTILDLDMYDVPKRVQCGECKRLLNGRWSFSPSTNELETLCSHSRHFYINKRNINTPRVCSKFLQNDFRIGYSALKKLEEEQKPYLKYPPLIFWEENKEIKERPPSIVSIFLGVILTFFIGSVILNALEETF